MYAVFAFHLRPYRGKAAARDQRHGGFGSHGYRLLSSS